MHVAHIGRGQVHAGFCLVKLMEGEYMEDLGVDGKIILNWVIEKWVRARTGFFWLSVRTGGGLF